MADVPNPPEPTIADLVQELQALRVDLQDKQNSIDLLEVEIGNVENDLRDLTADHTILQREHRALQTAHNLATAGATSTLITDPTLFKRSAYDREAPFNPGTKTGHILIEKAQSALQHSFDGKPLSLQPFLNSLAADVKTYHLQDVVTLHHTPAVALPDGQDINILENYGNITDDIIRSYFNNTRRDVIRGFDDTGTAIAANSLGSDDAERLLTERRIQDIKILYYKLKKSLTSAYGKTILPKLDDFGEDGTQLLIHLIRNTQSTTSAAMRNAQADLNKLSFKEAKYDIERLHTRFDDLVSTLKAGQSELSTSQQIMYLLQAYETCDNGDWTSHVCMLRSSVNIGTMKDVQTVKDSAKTYIGDLIRFGRWKKQPVPNSTAFLLGQNGGNPGNSKDKSWKYDRSLSKSSTYSRNNTTYNWCNGPGHGGRGMWVVHTPNTCKPLNKTVNTASGDGNTTQKGLSNNQLKKQRKKLTALFTDNNLSPAELAAKAVEVLND